MIFGRSKKWRDWRQHIVDRCDALTRGMTPPIPLQEIFTQCRVKKVVFQPLMVEGAIAVDDDGFVVFVNCDESSREAYQLAFSAAGQNGRYLPGRVRFSLAHELAHTFFYNTNQRPYTNRLSGTHVKEIESLETTCNFGASHLLLPTRSLKADTYKNDVLTIDGITDLAKRYQVSFECLINRLVHLEDWTPKRGLVAFVRQDADGYRVKAIAKSAAVRELFKNVHVDVELETAFRNMPIETMKRRISGKLNFDLTYPNCRATGFGIAKCGMEYRRVSSAPKAFVVTLCVDELTRSTTKIKPSYNADQLFAELRKSIEQ